MPTIEEIWRSLGEQPQGVVHQRVDEAHPVDLYLQFEPPDRPGLLLVSNHRPPECPSLKCLDISRGLRSDGKWSLSLVLADHRMEPVFAKLCKDIVDFTRAFDNSHHVAVAVLGRVARWRAMFEQGQAGMSSQALRGLIGELLILETELIPTLGPIDAITAWRGPDGAPQDFLLPDGTRIEVKAIRHDLNTIQVNGLQQLDAQGDLLLLRVVRLVDVGAEAVGAETAQRIVERIERRLAAEPVAATEFAQKLARAGWFIHPSHDDIIVRVSSIDRFVVDDRFPVLTSNNRPHPRIIDATYTIDLPVALGAVP